MFRDLWKDFQDSSNSKFSGINFSDKLKAFSRRTSDRDQKASSCRISEHNRRFSANSSSKSGPIRNRNTAGSSDTRRNRSSYRRRVESDAKALDRKDSIRKDASIKNDSRKDAGRKSNARRDAELKNDVRKDADIKNGIRSFINIKNLNARFSEKGFAQRKVQRSADSQDNDRRQARVQRQFNDRHQLRDQRRSNDRHQSKDRRLVSDRQQSNGRRLARDGRLASDSRLAKDSRLASARKDSKLSKSRDQRRPRVSNRASSRQAQDQFIPKGQRGLVRVPIVGRVWSRVSRGGFFEEGEALRFSSRDVWFLAILTVFAMALIIQLFFLQVVQAEENSSKSTSRRTSVETIFAKRGTIYDRNGNILATSEDAVTIYVDPNDVTDPEATANEIAAITGEDASTYIDALSKEDTSFSYVIRQASTSLKDQLQERYTEIQTELEAEAAAADSDELGNNPLEALHYIDDTRRVYPYGEIAGQVIGYVGYDNEGLSGIEKQYDEILRGTDGEQEVEYGKGGILILGGTTVYQEAVDGQDIMISIDISLQQIAEETLLEYAESSDAEGGEITIIDGETGEIYATASLPLYDLNNVDEAEEGASVLKTVSNIYEPGSIFKSVTAALLLESGLVSTDEYIDVPDSLQVDTAVISDSHSHDTTSMSLKDILTDSSNVGITLLEQRMESEDFYEGLVSLGFGQSTGVDYPAEAQGLLSSYEEWSNISESNISFGQGVAVTSIQIASFYATVANGGVQVQPHFLIAYPESGEEVSYESSRVLSEETCDVLTEMLCNVVNEGTGANAAISGYQVAGKTGTSQKISESGEYSNSEYIIDFAGFLANTNSTLACVVALDNPSTSSSMTIFSEVMGEAANKYMVVNE